MSSLVGLLALRALFAALMGAIPAEYLLGLFCFLLAHGANPPPLSPEFWSRVSLPFHQSQALLRERITRRGAKPSDRRASGRP